MPNDGPIYRQTPEYQKKLVQRELVKTFGQDYPYLEWVDNLFLRLGKTPRYELSDKDQDAVEKAKYILQALLTKYSPDQPRAPRGNSDGGQWTDGGGGGRSTPRATLPRRRLQPAMSVTELARFNLRAPEDTPPEELEIHPDFGLPRWYVGGAVSRVGSPLTDAMIAVPAAHAAAHLARVTVTEAAATINVLRSRATGRVAAEESSAKISRAADAVEEFLGGRPHPKDVIINSKGDMVIIKGNRKFRMDVKDPGDKYGPNGTKIPDEPHFHLQELKDGEWQDAGETHRGYFKKGDVE